MKSIALFLEKISTFVKKYWGLFLLFFGGIFGYLLLKKNPVDNDSKTVRDQHDKQLDKIDSIRKDERDKEDVAEQKLQSDIQNIERQYEENKKELDEKKKQEIKTILQTYKDDPTGLAKKLSDVTGFRIIMPEE